MSKSLFFRTFFIFFMIVLQSCAPGFETTPDEIMSDAAEENHSLFSVGKVQLDLETMARSDEKILDLNPQFVSDEATLEVSSFQHQDFLLPEKTRLVKVYDQECLQRGTEVLPGELKVRAKSFTLSYRMSLAQLVHESEREECLTQVANDLHLKVGQVRRDPFMNQQKQLAAIGFDSVSSSFFGANGIQRNIVVAVLDTGVDYRHPDLRNQMWRNSLGDYGYDFVNGDRDPMDDHSHGTHVAGLVGAEMGNGIGGVGVMGKRVKILAVKVLPSSGGGSLAAIINGIRWAADQGAHIINMSLAGGGKSSALEAALKYAVGKGSFIVVAAGNDGAYLSSWNFVAPASYSRNIDGMMTIGSILSSMDRRSSFSNYSRSYVDIGAPGESGILSTVPGGAYMEMSGTSMATPIVAGAAGLVYGMAHTRGYSVTPSQM